MAPVGRLEQQLVRVTRTPTGFEREVIAPVRFVPMTGKAQDIVRPSEARAVQPSEGPRSPPIETARGDAMIGSFLARRAKALDERFLRGVPSIAAWRESRPRLERELYSMLGPLAHP